MTKLRPDRDRWLALGLLLLVLALAYLLLIHPWWTVPLRQINREMATAQQREQRITQLLAQAPEIERRLEQINAGQAATGFLPEATMESATAGLMQRLETVVAQASPGNRSCAISSRSPLSDPQKERYPRVVVHVRLNCGMPELTAVLHALESGSPVLFIDRLSVTGLQPLNPDAGGSGGVDASFDLYGYLPLIQDSNPQAQAEGSTDAP